MGHPSEDEDSRDGEVADNASMAKRRRTTGPITSSVNASPINAKTEASLNQVVAVPSPGKPTARAAAVQQDEKPELLYSRVCLQLDADEEAKKARVTAVEGKNIEVVTEGNWSTMNVSIGVSTITSRGPTDFGFLIPDANQGSQVAAS